MIIYLASYPRSGNSWIQKIFDFYFDIRCSNFYHEPGSKHNLSTENNVVIGNRFVELNNLSKNVLVSSRLADNCGLILDKSLRKQLASSEKVFLIKTHELPYDEYYDNEFVIYLIRHPGAVAWSYLNLKMNDSPSVKISLVEVIIGDSFVNSWSYHANRWNEFGGENPLKYSLVKYEDIGEDLSGLVMTLQKICNQPIQNQDKPFPSFEHWHRLSPLMYRSGKKDEWVSNLNQNEAILLWLINQKTMEKYKYDMKNYWGDLYEPQISSKVLDHAHDIFQLIRKILLDHESTIQSIIQNNINKDKAIDILNDQILNKDEAINFLQNQIINMGTQLNNTENGKVIDFNRSFDLHTNNSYLYNSSLGLPIISIIVPSFNQGEFLRCTLDSIFKQNYPNIEVIVMDGGSSDESVSIIQEYEHKIHYWKSAPDNGQADAINTGMLYASGDLVTWLNSDDWYINDSLWVIAKVYSKYPKYGLIIGNGFREKEGLMEPFCPRHIAISQNILLEGMDYFLQPSTFISGIAWKKSGGLRTDIHYGFDWEFFNRILIDFPVVTINEFLSVSREHNATKTNTGKMRRAQELIGIAQSLTNKEMTLGSTYYLLETLLQLNETETPTPTRHSIYQGMLRIQDEMKSRWSTSDAFPVYSDRNNVNYFQIPDTESKKYSKPRAKQNLPKISITIPSFNQADYLGKAIHSIIDQNYPNLELFIYDGGSSDESVNIIKENQNYITDWSSAPDNGPADAINKGLLRSTGDIICWLNSDDMLSDGALWSISDAFMSDPDTQVVFGNAVYIDENDDLFIADHGSQKTGFYYGKLQPLEKVPYYWQYVHAIPQPTVYFRKELREKVGIINSDYKFIFDFEYFWRMRKVSEFKKIERTLAFYRIHSMSKTSNWNNFLIELYKFSRPNWPAINSNEYTSIQSEYTQKLIEREFGGYRRRLYPIKQLLKIMMRYQLGNPEKIIKLVKKNKDFVKYHAPIIKEDNRSNINYQINTTNRKYQIAYCGFFFPRHPGQSGGEIRDFHILRKLSELGEIDFFALSTAEQNNREDHLRPSFRTIHDPLILTSCLPELIDLNALKLSLSTKFLGWLRNRKFPVYGAHYHEDVSKVAYLNDAYVKKGLHHVLKVNLPDFLVISPQLNPLPLQIYKDAYNTRIILSSYDVEKIRLDRLAASQKGTLQKFAMQLESQRAAKFEKEALKTYDGIIAVSELDKQNYIELYGYESERILVLENSVDTDYYSYRERIATVDPEIVFTASMGYFPNDEAAKRLITKIMPLVRKKYPTARLWIVGQNPSNELMNMSDNVLNIVTGSVPDIRPYMDNATVACIPLQTGSGTKYKVLEAASLGVPIVCTRLSIEGLNLSSEDHVILGETDFELANGIINVIKDPGSRICSNKKASEDIQKEYSWNANLEKLEPWLEIIKSLPIR